MSELHIRVTYFRVWLAQARSIYIHIQSWNQAQMIDKGRRKGSDRIPTRFDGLHLCPHQLTVSRAYARICQHMPRMNHVWIPGDPMWIPKESHGTLWKFLLTMSIRVQDSIYIQRDLWKKRPDSKISQSDRSHNIDKTTTLSTTLLCWLWEILPWP